MEFEAVPIKAAQNVKKHKVSFDDAMAYTFADPDHSVGESRWLMFGVSGMGRVLAEIYTERRGKVRFISVRVATKHERKIYEED